jgi:hypothetical protein
MEFEWSELKVYGRNIAFLNGMIAIIFKNVEE